MPLRVSGPTGIGKPHRGGAPVPSCGCPRTGAIQRQGCFCLATWGAAKRRPGRLAGALSQM
eukprot:10227097-Alexandrium_andersonii.AAC.1